MRKNEEKRERAKREAARHRPGERMTHEEDPPRVDDIPDYVLRDFDPSEERGDGSGGGPRNPGISDVDEDLGRSRR